MFFITTCSDVRRVMHSYITAWYTSASHPALQMDWGEGMENTWILLLSSALRLFSYIKVFYQCHQVHGELQCNTTLYWMIGCWWCCARKIWSCGELCLKKQLDSFGCPEEETLLGAKGFWMCFAEADAAGLIHCSMEVEMLGGAWWFAASKCTGKSIGIRLKPKYKTWTHQMQSPDLHLRPCIPLYGWQKNYRSPFCNRFCFHFRYVQDMLRSELQQCFVAWLNRLRHLEREK